MKRIVSGVVTICVLTFGATAAAQDQPPPGNPLPGLTSTTSTIATSVGATVLVVVLVMRSGNKGDDAGRAAELYLRQNAVQLAQDLAVGKGPTVTELASAFQLSREDAVRFAELLRRDRKALLELADVERLDPERALAFGKRLNDLLSTDIRLDAHLDRLAATAL
jgi:hypothetical protein